MKILAISNAHALAHVSRLLEIAKVLRTRGHEILFAGHGKYLQTAAWDDFPLQELPYISIERIVEAVRTKKFWTIYQAAELETFIDAELELYKNFQPDLVLLDNRPSARTSADIAGIKTAAVLNVHMSNYRRIPFSSYEQLTHGFPFTAWADRLENRIERLIYNHVGMGRLNTIRAKRGLRALYAYEHEEGDISLLADIPEFNPVTALPAHARYVGPLTWHNTLPAPACLNFLDPNKPTIYFTLGSAGLDELLVHLGKLAAQNIQMVVATGAAELAGMSTPKGVFLERFINADALLPHCDLVVCHGGNGTLYQALSFGLPCVVVATHAEQHYGGKRIRQLGLGLNFTLNQVRRAGISKLIEAIQHVLNTPIYRDNVKLFSVHLKHLNASERAANTIESIFSKP